jgi:7,8-dihydropterin-6-yl-methyl-4-(beta-D-ribofuranosyl)aminobenzene 5'-phosphate synthase
MDGTDVVKRALPIKDMEVKNSVLAEHGFSALVTVVKGDEARSLLFDFGFSAHGAAFNVDALGVDLSGVEAMVLSHGHMDHFGGVAQLTERVGKSGMELYLHPAAFRKARYLKIAEELKIGMPTLLREEVEKSGLRVVETKEPRLLLDGSLLFLGEIPRTTAFEKGFPGMCYEDNGEEKQDPIEDDTAIVANVKGKGLVVLSGCAHSGIINTTKYAKEVTGVDPIYAIMGGFHLTGSAFEPIIEPTVKALKDQNPEYIVPTHCTGRKAIMRIEQEMESKFLLNMSGTTMVFEA